MFTVSLRRLKMETQREIGDKGEAIARAYLLQKGYSIIAGNWYFGHLELDIVATDGDELVIVEVKSRTGDRYEHPSEALSGKKIRQLVEAAEGFIQQTNWEGSTRFDLITVIFTGSDTYELEHFEEAFLPPA